MSTKISFFKESGKVINKRKRMTGTDSSRKPEIKQCNVIKDNENNYSAITLYPIVLGPGSVLATNLLRPYRLHVLTYPKVGNEAWQRVGNSIFLRNLRIKGYVALTSRLFRPINWKLYLYRFEGEAPWNADYETNFEESTADYFEMFKNVQTYSDSQTPNEVRINSRHNFYKKVRKYPKEYNYTCKCIASGTVPATNEIGNMSYSTLGSSGATVGYYSPLKIVANEDVGVLPLDVNVKINDRVTFVQSNSLSTPATTWTANVYYFLAYEDDLGVGWYVQAVSSGSAINNTVSLSNQDAHRPFTMEFWGKWFYTDD